MLPQVTNIGSQANNSNNAFFLWLDQKTNKQIHPTSRLRRRIAVASAIVTIGIMTMASANAHDTPTCASICDTAHTPSYWPVNRKDANIATAVPRICGAICVACV